MPTLHETGLEASFQRAIADGWASAIDETHEKLRAHRYQPRWLVDAFFLNHRGAISRRDAYGFMLCWSHLVLGEIGCTPIFVGHKPAADAEQEANQRILNDGLAEPFQARLIAQRGRGADDDGTFRWTKEMTVGWHTSSGLDERPCKPGCVPLEIGTTDVSRTLLHLRSQGGVARWPYRSERVIVLVMDAAAARRAPAIFDPYSVST